MDKNNSQMYRKTPEKHYGGGGGGGGLSPMLLFVFLSVGTIMRFSVGTSWGLAPQYPKAGYATSGYPKYGIPT